MAGGIVGVLLVGAMATIASCGARGGLEGEVDASVGERAGSCAARCTTAAECCPPGDLACPGPYPRNWSCRAGFCELGGCSTHAECQSGGSHPELECHPAGGRGICFDPCELDADCAATPGATCRGPVDDGARLCGAFEFGCADDAECLGWGVCDVPDGICRCWTDADCAAPGAGCRRE
jgi:hypothetical protein